MGSLHCARICMDVIAALIGRCRGRPASQPRSPRLADSAAPVPPPRNEAARPRGRGGAGVPRAEGAGRGTALSGLEAGVEDLSASRRRGLNLQVEVSQVVGNQAGKPGIGSPEVEEDVLGSHDVSVPLASRSCKEHARRGEGPYGQDAERPREARSSVVSLQLLILQIRPAP